MTAIQYFDPTGVRPACYGSQNWTAAGVVAQLRSVRSEAEEEMLVRIENRGSYYKSSDFNQVALPSEAPGQG
jgi:hypothetical protein